jgi:F420-0:gamma-glutamyl ligase
LTIKDGVLLPSAGIDESNSPNGDFLLMPSQPFEALKTLHETLAREVGHSQFGLLMTDSRSQPLRWGVNGLAYAHYGFEAIRDRRGTPDLYGRNLKVTTINDADAFASMAVMLMGESNECSPLCLIRAPWVRFQKSGSPEEIQIPVDEDLYGSLLLKLESKSTDRR